jgi:hypothetical protein
LDSTAVLMSLISVFVAIAILQRFLAVLTQCLILKGQMG